MNETFHHVNFVCFPYQNDIGHFPPYYSGSTKVSLIVRQPILSLIFIDGHRYKVPRRLVPAFLTVVSHQRYTHSSIIIISASEESLQVNGTRCLDTTWQVLSNRNCPRTEKFTYDKNKFFLNPHWNSVKRKPGAKNLPVKRVFRVHLIFFFF